MYTAHFAKGYKALKMLLLIITLVTGSIYWQTGKCHLLRSLGSIVVLHCAQTNSFNSMPQHPTRYPFILLGGERQT